MTSGRDEADDRMPRRPAGTGTSHEPGADLATTGTPARDRDTGPGPGYRSDGW